jgi:hypothetical protein
MSYIPITIIKYSNASDPVTVGSLVRLLGNAVLESLPATVVSDTVQIMTKDGAAPGFIPIPITTSSGRIEALISDASFRYLAWRLDLSEGSVGWKIRLSMGAFPSVTFGFDLLAAEGQHPSEKEIAKHSQTLIDSRFGDVLETPNGYYGYQERIFLRYILQREQQLFRGEQRSALVNTQRLKAFSDTASLRGVASEVPVHVLASKVDKWACATAERLGTDLVHAGTWLTDITN